MPEAILPPALRQRVERLALALLAARRARTLYPPHHPAALAGLERLAQAVAEATGGLGLLLGVTPTTLLVAGVPAGDGGPIAEAAAVLHEADIAEIAFANEVPREAVEALLELIVTPPDMLRRQGGAAAVWARWGHDAVSIVQLDYRPIFEDREVARTPATRDALWRAIVHAVTEGHECLDENLQRRLLEIAGDVDATCELAREVAAPACTPDGSPLVTTQAAMVLAVFRHLLTTVAALDPDRRDATVRTLAAATMRLDPRVAWQMLAAAEEAGEGDEVFGQIAGAFDDDQVAQLLATTLALDGQATPRLARVFETLAPDPERKRSVLRLARDRLKASDFGQRTSFEALWTSVEELLVHYTERPFVAAGYRAALDAVHGRAGAMAGVDLPPEAGAWFGTLDPENIRRLSVTLLVDLLNLETDGERAETVADDVASLAEDLLMAGDYGLAERLVRALAARAADPRAATAAASRGALDRLARSAALHETLRLVDELDTHQAETLAGLCRAIGAPVVDALAPLLTVEEATRGRGWAIAVVVALGPPAVAFLAPLARHERWFVQRTAASILGQIASAEAVPLLQPLLRHPDPRVLGEAVRALSAIDHPSAARAIHSVLRTASGAGRQAVVAALVVERDPRVVPVLLRILAESRVLGSDHRIVLDTLAALGTLGAEEAIGPVARLMHRRSWLAWWRMRAVKRCALDTLRAIGTPAALAVIAESARSGDRMLRRLARAYLA